MLATLVVEMNWFSIVSPKIKSSDDLEKLPEILPGYL